MGLIYLINEIGTNNYKIGITRSKTERKRKKNLQTGNSIELETIYTYKTEYPFKIESMLHFYYVNKHIKGEWFELSDEDVLDFINVCTQKEKQLQFLIKSNHFFSENDIK